MRSFRLLRLFGIDIKIHASFLALPVFFAFIYGKDYGWEVGLRAFVLVMLIFACVLGHELSHSLKAKSLGIDVPEINLYLIGGVASMQRIPREPAQEFAISIVGPLFNFALTLVLYFPFVWLIGRQDLFMPSLESWPRMLANVYWANPVLGAFNLIPAFPMDGGRVLRSFLARRMSYRKATGISVMLGQIFAILFALLGLWRHNWMLVLVAVFVFSSASKEMAYVAAEEDHRERLRTEHGPKDQNSPVDLSR